jgi:hypothetical protein
VRQSGSGKKKKAATLVTLSLPTLVRGVSSVDACTVAAPDVITALAVPNRSCSALSLSFEQTVLANPVAKLRIVCGSIHFNVGAIVHPIVLGKPNH